MFEPSEETLTLSAMLSEIPAGAYITYSAIQDLTGVRMDTRGKQLLRSAARSERIEYRVDRGKGIELGGANNSMAIVTGRLRRIESGLKRADKTTSNLSGFFSDMPKADQTRFAAAASLLGAIRTVSNGLSKLYEQKPEALETIYEVPLPKYDEK